MTESFHIKSWQGCSFLDWPGRLASVIFLGGCNYRCPFCHNHALVLEPELLPDIPLEAILGHCRDRSAWIDGVVVSGGEPTLNGALPELLRNIRRAGLPVKLDTNGSRPQVLEKLLAEGLLDHVAMDLKAPLEDDAYRLMTGVRADVAAVGRSIKLILASGVEYTFRTTVVPGALTDDELAALARTVPDGPALQAFRPADALDPAWRARRGHSAEELAELARFMERQRTLVDSAISPVAA